METAQLTGLIESAVAEAFHTVPQKIGHVGKGISGMVYRVSFGKPPYYVVVKAAKDRELIEKERDAIACIRAHVDIKMPELYFLNHYDSISLLCMQYFDGVSCSNPYILNAPQDARNRLAVQIADNIGKLQQVKGDFYGPIENAHHTDWHAFYRPFAESIVTAARRLAGEGAVPSQVLRTMETAMDRYDGIFDEPISRPTLIHGDYWAANLIADKHYNLIGVVDPFNVQWADSEYELFGLNAVYGDRLDVYGAFKARNRVSRKCDLKTDFYVLISEVYWVTVMGHDNRAYLTQLAQRLEGQMKRFGLL